VRERASVASCFARGRRHGRDGWIRLACAEHQRYRRALCCLKQTRWDSVLPDCGVGARASCACHDAAWASWIPRPRAPTAVVLPLHPGDASSAIDDVRSTVSHASMWRRDVQADKGISRMCCGDAFTGPRASLPPSQRAPERSGKSSCFSLKSRSTSMSAACAAAREPAMADTEAAISSPTRRYRLSATLTVPRHVAHPDAPLVSYLHDSLAYLSGTLPRATRITPLTSRGLNEPCK
jgi:hypothetical protein